MAKAFYSDYVNHCIRFYVRNPKVTFRSESDRHDWEACEKAFATLRDEDEELIREIYKRGDTVADNIYEISKERELSQDYLWMLIKAIERRVAKRRGLL